MIPRPILWALILALLALPLPAWAAPGGLAAHRGTLTLSFLVLLGILVVLVVWEMMDRGRPAPRPSNVRELRQPAPAAAPAGVASGEDDPFRSLLQASAEKAATPAAAPVPLPEERPAAPPPPLRSAPIGSAQDEEEEEVSPFQRLSKIGAEDDTLVTAPAPPPRSVSLDVGRPPAPPPARPRVEPAPAASGGGDWADLLKKVQEDVAPAPPPRPSPPPAAEEADPWKKLLAEGRAASVAPSAPAEADPWEALLKKTVNPAPPPAEEDSLEIPPPPPVSRSGELPAAPVDPIRIRLGPSSGQGEDGPDETPPPPSSEGEKKRIISLDLKKSDKPDLGG